MFFRVIICVVFVWVSTGIAIANAQDHPAGAKENDELTAITPSISNETEQSEESDELTAIAPSIPSENVQDIEGNVAVLQGLNKVTGHTSKLEGPIGAVMRFGTLEIIPRRCLKALPEERPENAVLLEIRELKPGEGPQNIFLGWMFSSSPGLSGLENAVYDINVVSCEMVSDPEKNTDTITPKEPTPKKKHNKDQ